MSSSVMQVCRVALYMGVGRDMEASEDSMIKVVLWDIDGTLLDFEMAEKEAIRACFNVFDLGECTDEMIARYSVINKGYWERLERKEMTKPQIWWSVLNSFLKRKVL